MGLNPSDDQDRGWVTVREAAELLGLPRHSVYAGVARGEIPIISESPIKIPLAHVAERLADGVPA